MDVCVCCFPCHGTIPKTVAVQQKDEYVGGHDRARIKRSQSFLRYIHLIFLDIRCYWIPVVREYDVRLRQYNQRR